MATTKVRIFIDYWNFQLELNNRRAAELKVADHRFSVDWVKVGPWLASKACGVAGIDDYSFEGAILYTSHDANTIEGRKFHGWVTGWLAKQAGVHVECRERKPKMPPKCPVCHVAVEQCPHCKGAMRGTQEKGVDTLIATDMIRLAWENAYDLAVLATSDRDLIPAVEFLNVKGRKVIHAAFPPIGAELTKASWASFDVMKDAKEIERRRP